MAADDRVILAGAMAMNEQQAQALAILRRGEAAVFSEGDGVPLLVRIPQVKDQSAKPPPDDRLVAERMAAFRTSSARQAPSDPLADDTDLATPDEETASHTTAILVDNPVFQREFVRLVASATEDDSALDRLWEGVLAREQTLRRHGTDEKVARRRLIMQASRWFARRRGRQNSWTYTETAELEKKLRETLLAKLEGKSWAQALESLRATMHRLHRRPFEPFSGCAKICTQGTLCLYRRAVADMLASAGKDAGDDFDKAYLKDKEAGDGVPSTRQMLEQKAYQLVERGQRDAARRIGLCCAQHILADRLPETHDGILDDLLSETAAGIKNLVSNF